MSYKPEHGEVFYCGQCGEQQQPDANIIKCKGCGKPTVSWYTARGESEEDAKRRWKARNGQR